MKKGCVQIYYGTGKGKTTAALGQGLRGAGRGLKVFMIPFMKNADYGEVEALKQWGGDFKVFHLESQRDFFWSINEEEMLEMKEAFKNILQFAHKIIKNQQCDILILDEILEALDRELITMIQVETLLKERPETMEIILTGRILPKAIENYADYVTEMRQIRHPFEKGQPARWGIEY